MSLLPDKKTILLIVKVVAFFVSLYLVIRLSSEYLDHHYDYRLSLDENPQPSIPRITICTERGVFFDKNKVVNYFNLTAEYLEHKKKMDEDSEQGGDCTNESDCEMNKQKSRNVQDEEFFRPIERRIMSELNFEQMKALVISYLDLFECSARVHIKLKSHLGDVNATLMANCFDRLLALQSIFGNKDFGLCFTFFTGNHVIQLRDQDFIQITIRAEAKNNIIVRGDAVLYLIINDEIRKERITKKKALKFTLDGSHYNLNIQKTAVNKLTIPYMDKCIGQPELIKKRNNTEESTYVNQYNCVPNPFVHEHYVMIDMKVQDHRICDNALNIMPIESKMVIDNCYQDYYATTLESIRSLGSDTRISIAAIDGPEIDYIARPSKDSMLEYLAKLGGLLGFWFALSFIKLHKLLQNRIESRSHLYKLPGISIMFKSTMKYALSTIGTGILIYLSCIWIIDYLEFSSKISVKVSQFKNYGKVKLKHFPSITVCYKHNFKDLLFSEKYHDYFKNSFDELMKLYEMTGNSLPVANLSTMFESKSDKVQNFLKYTWISMRGKPIENFLKNYLDVSTEQELDDKLAKLDDRAQYGFNGTLAELDFYSDHYSCEIPSDPHHYTPCQTYMRTIPMVSSLGKCHMYLYWPNNHYYELADVAYDTVMIVKRNLDNKVTYFNNHIYLHETGSLPLNKRYFTSLDFGGIKSYKIEIRSYRVSRLPKPYDTNCQSYGHYYTKTNCLDACHKKKYLSYFNCLPNNPENYVMMLDEDSLGGYRFCHVQPPRMNFSQSCQDYCGNNCQETFFSAEVQEIVPGHSDKEEFKFHMSDMIEINYIPKYYFDEILSNILCLVILWHGFGLLHWFKKAMKALVNKVQQISCSNSVVKFIYVFIKSILSLQLTFLYIAIIVRNFEIYLDYPTRIRLDIRSYETDINRPVISIILADSRSECTNIMVNNITADTKDVEQCQNITTNEDRNSFNEIYFRNSQIYLDDNQSLMIIHAGVGYIGYLQKEKSSLIDGILTLKNYSVEHNQRGQVKYEFFNHAENYPEELVKILQYGWAPDDKMMTKALLHSSVIPSAEDVTHSSVDLLAIGSNHTISVRKSVKQYLSEPYGQCSHYELIRDSRTQCYRKCVRNQWTKSFECLPLFIDGISHELDDNQSSRICVTNSQVTEEWKDKVKRKCLMSCPKNCLSVQYSPTAHNSDTYHSANDLWSTLPESQRFTEVVIHWDTSQPLIAYIEEQAIQSMDILVRMGLFTRLYVGFDGLYLFKIIIDWLIRLTNRHSVSPVMDIDSHSVKY